MTVWPDNILSRLKELCRENTHSNSLIAVILNKEFGTNLSRCAVIGKRARVGLDGGRPTVSKPRENRPRPARRSPRDVPAVSLHKRHLRDRSPREAPTVFPHKCNLLDLSNETCRYPCGEVGGPGFFFCGTPEADLALGYPYCQAHTQLTQSPRER
jgi:GcrA cell cycle regulator